MANDIILTFIEHLQNDEVDRRIKPRVIESLGDLALVIKGHIVQHLPATMRCLSEGSQFSPEEGADIEDIEFINYLKTNILECYCSILQGLAEDGHQRVLLTAEYFASILHFLHSVALDNFADSEMTKQALALTADLCREFPKAVQETLSPQHAWVQQLILKGKNSPDERCIEMAKETEEQLQRLEGNEL